MPPRKKLCVPTQGKWNPVSIFFVPQPPKTNDEQVAERAEAEERKLRANEAKDRIKSVLKSLRIDAAVVESRSAGRPAAQQLWEDGLRGYVALVENGQATKHGEYVVTVPKDWAKNAKTTSCLIIQPITNPDPDCSVQRARLPLSKCGGSHPCNSTHGL